MDGIERVNSVRQHYNDDVPSFVIDNVSDIETESAGTEPYLNAFDNKDHNNTEFETGRSDNFFNFNYNDNDNDIDNYNDNEIGNDNDVELDLVEDSKDNFMMMVPRTLPTSGISEHLWQKRIRANPSDGAQTLEPPSGPVDLLSSADTSQRLKWAGAGPGPNALTMTTSLLNGEKLLRAATYPETEQEQKQARRLHELETPRLVVPPNVDSQERLWQEVGELEQIKSFARQVNMFESMFPHGFESNLNELRKLQNGLVHELRNYNAELEEQERKEIAKQAAASILTFTPPASIHSTDTALLNHSSSDIRLGGFSGANLKAEKYLRQLFEKITDMG
ncbi:hypothetical protein B1J92_H05423g [Nakaseomyces glabratus]|nr:hypothetical protein B1J91_H05423g [Nakaseomyces glabratus]OXB48201.1 hypothetical protein B1J92_H05423g [Nakaseomyces glabratus]